MPQQYFQKRKTHTIGSHTHLAPPSEHALRTPPPTVGALWHAMTRIGALAAAAPTHTQPPSASPARRPRIGALCHSRRSISCTRRYHMQTPSRSHAPPALFPLPLRPHPPPPPNSAAHPLLASLHHHPDEYTTDPAAPPPPSQITPTPAGSYISRLHPFPTVMSPPPLHPPSSVLTSPTRMTRPLLNPNPRLMRPRLRPTATIPTTISISPASSTRDPPTSCPTQ